MASLLRYIVRFQKYVLLPCESYLWTHVHQKILGADARYRRAVSATLGCQLRQYTGGQLWVASRTGGGRRHRTKNKLACFNARAPHRTLPFVGDRWTATFYVHASIKSASLQTKTELRALGAKPPANLEADRLKAAGEADWPGPWASRKTVGEASWRAHTGKRTRYSTAARDHECEIQCTTENI